jgi:hypothetical protein
MPVAVLDSTEIPAFGRDFRSTDFVRPVEAFGAAACRCATAISREPGAETVATRGRA